MMVQTMKNISGKLKTMKKSQLWSP